MKTPRLFWGLLLAGFWVTAALSYGAAEKITGTFIQYQPWMRRMNEAQWLVDLGHMRQAGIDTIVLQWHQNRNPAKGTSESYSLQEGSALDPTEIILSYADEHHMKVWLGLSFDSTWWEQWKDQAFLKKAAEENVAFSSLLWRRFQKYRAPGHQTLAGWYIPQELWDFKASEDQIKHLTTFLRDISDGCRRFTDPKLPVAVSVFFNRKVPVENTEALYTKLLPDAHIDVLLLQDGAGAHPAQGDFKLTIEPWYVAFERATSSAHTTLWGIPELFVIQPDKKRAPAPIERLFNQIAAEKQHVSKMVAFDFFHHMSPARKTSAHREFYRKFLSGPPSH